MKLETARMKMKSGLENLICDFCSSPEVATAYIALPFLVEELLPDGQVYRTESDEGWAACTLCSKFVDRGDRKGLLERSIETMGCKLEIPPRVVRQSITRLHEGFWRGLQRVQ